MMICCLSFSAAVAQHSSEIKKSTSQQQFNGRSNNPGIQVNNNWDEAVTEAKARHELESAQFAVESAQRKLNSLAEERQGKDEKFAKKLAKINDPVKREAEKRKYEEKMQKRLVKAQEKYDKAQARAMRALEVRDLTK